MKVAFSDDNPTVLNHSGSDMSSDYPKHRGCSVRTVSPPGGLNMNLRTCNTRYAHI